MANLTTEVVEEWIAQLEKLYGYATTVTYSPNIHRWSVQIANGRPIYLTGTFNYEAIEMLLLREPSG